MRRWVSILACASLAVLAAGSARADHETLPAWTPLAAVQPLGLAGTGNTACGLHALQAAPQTVTVDLRDGRTKGTVAASATTTCLTTVPVLITMSLAIYEDIGIGPLDGKTIGAKSLASLRLLISNTCIATLRANGSLGCSTASIGFSLKPGSRYVATSTTTYELKDPRGGVWLFVPPPHCKEGSTRAKATCSLAADFRA